MQKSIPLAYASASRQFRSGTTCKKRVPARKKRHQRKARKIPWARTGAAYAARALSPMGSFGDLHVVASSVRTPPCGATKLCMLSHELCVCVSSCVGCAAGTREVPGPLRKLRADPTNAPLYSRRLTSSKIAGYLAML
jgi:hypothetical protein